MNVPALRHDLQRAILDLSLLEGQAAVMARHLGTSPLLNEEERTFANDRLCPDEARHMRWTQEVAGFLGDFDLAALKRSLNQEIDWLHHRWQSEPLIPEDRRLVTRINFDERFLVRVMNRFRFVIERLLPPDLAAGAADIQTDELAHKAWGCGILHRLQGEHPEWIMEIKKFQTIENYPAEKIARRFRSIYDALGGDPALFAARNL